MQKLLVLVSEDRFLVSHFFPMVQAAQAAGYDVAVATRVTTERERILGAGCRIISFDIERSSASGFRFLRELIEANRIVRRERPDVVHCIALRMVAMGGLTAKLAGIKGLVLAPTGLGHLWISGGIPTRIVRACLRILIGRGLRGRGTRYLFENKEDPGEFGLDPTGPDVTIVPGSGVDPAAFPMMLEPPAPPVRVAVVSRMLRAKGIEAAADAIGRARKLGAAVELDLYGAPDPNPSSLSKGELIALSNQPGVKWHGHVEDVAAVWRDHHVALLLTEREGLPRSLVEAAACGRPIIATDVVGCREVVRNDKEGLLVPPGDVEAAAQAIVRLANDRSLRLRLGAAAYERFLGAFTADKVRDQMQPLYASFLRGARRTNV